MAVLPPDRNQISGVQIVDASLPPGGQPAVLPVMSSASAVSADLQAAYAEITMALADPAQLSTTPRVATASIAPGGNLRDLEVVVGVGIGLAEDADDLVSAPGETALELYTSMPTSKNEAVNYLASALGVQALSQNSVPIRVVCTGPIDTLAHRTHMRPAPGGISIGHYSISAGTLGCLATGRSSPRDNRMLALSNNHVLAALNAASAGDDVLQPGRSDGGTSPTHVVGLLERFVKIDFSSPNYVDCATAWVDENDVRRQLLYLPAGGTPAFFRVASTPKTATPGMTVGKSGRTTGLTVGRVTAVGVTVNVNMGDGRRALFQDQIAIQGLRGPFSSGGDSGSLAWEWNDTRAPVGLLFAGGGGTTFANRIDRVLNALDIDLMT